MPSDVSLGFHSNACLFSAYCLEIQASGALPGVAIAIATLRCAAGSGYCVMDGLRLQFCLTHSRFALGSMSARSCPAQNRTLSLAAKHSELARTMIVFVFMLEVGRCRTWGA